MTSRPRRNESAEKGKKKKTQRRNESAEKEKKRLKYLKWVKKYT